MRQASLLVLSSANVHLLITPYKVKLPWVASIFVSPSLPPSLRKGDAQISGRGGGTGTVTFNGQETSSSLKYNNHNSIAKTMLSTRNITELDRINDGRARDSDHLNKDGKP